MLHRNEWCPSLYQQEGKNLFLSAHNLTKKPILHKKKKSTGVGAVFQSVKFLILLQEPRE